MIYERNYAMENNNLFSIEECKSFSPTDADFKKLDISSEDQASISIFLSQMPALMSASALSNAYVLKFPEGVSGTLMKLKRGGYSTVMTDKGKIVGHASIQSLENSAALLSAFSVMSIVTGQFFMSRISNDFEFVKQKIDKILDFLYGEKKAELFAEVSFVKQAYENFASIMRHPEQCAATIVNLQNAQKIAMKDIEFYINDLNGKSKEKPKSYEAFCNIADEAIKIKDCLMLAIQLYATTGLMEANFSQNSDGSYLKYLKDTLCYYVKKTESGILSCFSSLRTNNSNYKPNAVTKFDTAPLDKRLGAIEDSFNNGDQSQLYKTIERTLNLMNSAKEIYITSNGDAYLKTA